MFKNYVEVRDWLEGYIPETYSRKELGLGRIENLLSKLGNPHKKFKSIHVAGTSGKGSTAFYTARILQYLGYKVGLHVSPHLLYIGERMQINGKSIPVKRLVTLVNEIKPVVDEIKSKQLHLTPSYFEILVALTFLYFAKEKVDWAVVEVGLGGRLDATNVLSPEVCVITNIGLDHTEILGNKLEQIAGEKAGIIKTRVPVVTGATGIALKVIEKAAKAQNAFLINIYTQGVKNLKKTDLFSSITTPNDIYRYIPYYVNAECVLLAISAVLELKKPLSSSMIKKAFSLKFAGRFDEIVKDVIVDGAHNIDKIRALLEFVRKYQVSSIKYQIVLVLAFKKGKKWQKMVDLLMKNLQVRTVVVTEFLSNTDMGRYASVDAREVADYAASMKYKVSSIKTIMNSQEALFSAINGKKENDLVLVTGSLYLVGEVQTLWKLPEF